MKIAIYSDLHLELGDLDPVNTGGADVLVLAGDILIANDFTLKSGSGRARAEMYGEFLIRASSLYNNIVCIAGNHEFYGGRWGKTLGILRDEYSKYNNIHFLENETVDIGGYTFVGSTFWTDLNGRCPITARIVKDSMNDYRLITYDGENYRKITPEDTLARHTWSRNYLTDVLEWPDRKFIVVTHTAPSSLSIAPQYRGDHYGNGGYYTDMGNYIADRPQINLWIHGHTHNPFDYTIGNTRVVCNPRGYVGVERGQQADDPYWPLQVEL
jgi:predicted phosphodiesterase